MSFRLTRRVECGNLFKLLCSGELADIMKLCSVSMLAFHRDHGVSVSSLTY